MSSVPNLTIKSVVLCAFILCATACYREPTEALESHPMLPYMVLPESSSEGVVLPRVINSSMEVEVEAESVVSEREVGKIEITNGVGGLKLQPSTRANSLQLKDTMYDVSIRKWSSVYTPEYPWCWNKAQIRAESAFRVDAVSPVGAKGLGQFMPATWKQMVRELGMESGSDAFNPALNIQATTYYMAKLRANFKAPRPEWDKHSLAMASYNAGLGNILKAQAYTGSLMYTPMVDNLHRVTGHHHIETKNYVTRIWGYVAEYEKEGLCE